mgnify:CR=1 FL=1
MRKPIGYWTKEKVHEVALKCKTRNEFKDGGPDKEGSRPYSLARRNNWLEEVCSHMLEIKKPKGYWTEQTAREAALKCESRTEFRKKYAKAYYLATDLGILKECCSHMKVKANKMKRLVYAFEFPKTNTAYIGITWNAEERFHRHTTQAKSPVFKHIEAKDSNFIFKKLTRRIKVENVIKKEKYFIEKYIEEGWNLLNKKLEGGQLGSPERKWTREKVIEEAKKYKTQKEFREKGGGAKNAASFYKISDEELFGHMPNLGLLCKPNGYWTEEKILEDAKKYSTPKEWQEASKSAVAKATILKIYQKATAHMYKGARNGNTKTGIFKPELGVGRKKPKTEENGWTKEKRKETWGMPMSKNPNWKGGVFVNKPRKEYMHESYLKDKGKRQKKYRERRNYHLENDYYHPYYNVKGKIHNGPPYTK